MSCLKVMLLLRIIVIQIKFVFIFANFSTRCFSLSCFSVGSNCRRRNICPTGNVCTWHGGIRSRGRRRLIKTFTRNRTYVIIRYTILSCQIRAINPIRALGTLFTFTTRSLFNFRCCSFQKIRTSTSTPPSCWISFIFNSFREGLCS
jgi:hypothetical protein